MIDAILTLNEINDFVYTSKSGRKLPYHKGFLCLDACSDTDTRIKRKALQALQESDRVHLLQKRISEPVGDRPGEFLYFAVVKERRDN